MRVIEAIFVAVAFSGQAFADFGDMRVWVNYRHTGPKPEGWVKPSRKGKLISFNAPGYYVPKAPLGGGWTGGAIAVCVPPGADRLAVHLSVKRQREDETTSFRNVRAVEIR